MHADRPTDPDAVAAALAAPFPPEEVKYLPKNVKGTRCLAFAYVDARVVQDRLDAVLGVNNWQDSYEVTGNGDAICTLRLRIAGEWVAKSDAGAFAENLGGEGLKAAFSDALKRTAAKFGVARYLYSLGSVWADYDPVKKCITKPPQLPAWALPQQKGGDRSPPQSPPPATTAPINEADRKTYLPLLEQAAVKGEAELHEQWKKIGNPGRTACQLDLDGLKKVAGWADWFAADPTLAKINEEVPRMLATKNGYVRALVMKVATDYCAQAGAVWDERSKVFTQGFAETR